MIDFIIKLEDMLRMSGNESWEIEYVPKANGYILRIDGDSIFMCKGENK
jgi:hypothetical protein